LITATLQIIAVLKMNYIANMESIKIVNVYRPFSVMCGMLAVVIFPAVPRNT